MDLCQKSNVSAFFCAFRGSRRADPKNVMYRHHQEEADFAVLPDLAERWPGASGSWQACICQGAWISKCPENNAENAALCPDPFVLLLMMHGNGPPSKGTIFQGIPRRSAIRDSPLFLLAEAALCRCSAVQGVACGLPHSPNSNLGQSVSQRGASCPPPRGQRLWT